MCMVKSVHAAVCICVCVGAVLHRTRVKSLRVILEWVFRRICGLDWHVAAAHNRHLCISCISPARHEMREGETVHHVVGIGI